MEARGTILAHGRQKGQPYARLMKEKRAARLGQVALGSSELLPRHHFITYASIRDGTTLSVDNRGPDKGPTDLVLLMNVERLRLLLAGHSTPAVRPQATKTHGNRGTVHKDRHWGVAQRRASW